MAIYRALASLVALCCLLTSQHVRAQYQGQLSEQQILDRCTLNSVTPLSCADVETVDGLVPHPDDCELFYYCVQPNLAPVCRQCPANLHFNPILHVCDWPDQAGCNQTSNAIERCAQRSVTPVSCDGAVTRDGLLPHPDDCELFYYCVQPYLPPVCRQCPANLHFNPVLYVCDWPSRAGCASNNGTTDIPVTSEWVPSNETSTESDVDYEYETAQSSDTDQSYEGATSTYA